MSRLLFIMLLLGLAFPKTMSAQSTASDSVAFFIRGIYDVALTEQRSYDWLHFMCTEIGPRLSGSTGYERASVAMGGAMDSMGLKVTMQPCLVPRWQRGKASEVRITSPKSLTLPSAALGNSERTKANGEDGDVVEVNSLDMLDSLGKAGSLRDKIVFLNQPMNRKAINTYEAYGAAGVMRVQAPGRAGKYGAKAAIVRSLASGIDDYPHTGVTVYGENPAIPAVAISTRAAEQLSDLLDQQPVKMHVYSDAHLLDSVMNNNVIGEWRGSTNPEKVILVGGHLDSWDLGQGTHDDGAGCVQAMEALYILKRMGYTPKHTLRCVLFANEENGLSGGTTYARTSDSLGEFHLAAIESDAGGFTPRGFSFEGHETVASSYFAKMAPLSTYLEPYGIDFFRGGSGADISPLRSQKGMMVGLRPDSQRYFFVHHAATDNIDSVNPRELALGGAAMAALIYLIDQNLE